MVMVPVLPKNFTLEASAQAFCSTLWRLKYLVLFALFLPVAVAFGYVAVGAHLLLTDFGIMLYCMVRG